MAASVGTRGNRATPERLAIIEQAMRECWPRGKIQRTFAKKWECTQRTIRTYIKRVERDWAAAAADVDKDTERQLTVELFGEVYRRSMAAAAVAMTGGPDSDEGEEDSPDADPAAAAGVAKPKAKGRRKKSLFAAAAHYRVALQAADRRALYLGLRPASRVALEDQNGKPLAIAPDAAAAELARALDRVVDRTPAAATEAPPAPAAAAATGDGGEAGEGDDDDEDDAG